MHIVHLLHTASTSLVCDLNEEMMDRIWLLNVKKSMVEWVQYLDGPSLGYAPPHTLSWDVSSLLLKACKNMCSLTSLSAQIPGKILHSI